MSDFTTRARETAEREAERVITHEMHAGAITGALPYRVGYLEGFTTAVSRLPSEEQIAENLASEFAQDAFGNLTPRDIARAVRELIEKKMLEG